MDFMLEEELIDLFTFCLQNPDSPDIEQKKIRIKEIGKELFTDGGVDALENFFFVITNRIEGEINKSPAPFRSLWNGLSDRVPFYPVHYVAHFGNFRVLPLIIKKNTIIYYKLKFQKRHMNENCYLCKKTLTDTDSYNIGSVWSCEKCLDHVIQLVNENRIKNED